MPGGALQNNMKRKISWNIFTQCDNKSNNKGIKEECKMPLFKQVSTNILSLAPKISSFNWEGGGAFSIYIEIP